MIIDPNQLTIAYFINMWCKNRLNERLLIFVFLTNMDRVNLKKLSSILGLSISTVSKALRDSYEISAATKLKVQQAAKFYNYQPNPHASSLRKAKSKTIAVIVPEITNNYFVAAINAIQDIARSKEYHVLIYITHESYEYEKSLVNPLINGRVDGVIISLSRNTKNIDHLKDIGEKGTPIVFFDRVTPEPDYTTVTTNDFEIAYKATQHLINNACKKIAHVTFSEKISIGEQRLEGFNSAMQDNNLAVLPHYVITAANNEREDYNSIKKLLTNKDRPDAVFTAIESFALTTYRVCAELGLNIPKDIKVISFSNLITAELLNPPLTTIEQPAYEIGSQAALMLIHAIEKPKYYTPENITIPSKLIPRASSNKQAITPSVYNDRALQDNNNRHK